MPFLPVKIAFIFFVISVSSRVKFFPKLPPFCLSRLSALKRLRLAFRVLYLAVSIEDRKVRS